MKVLVCGTNYGASYIRALMTNGQIKQPLTNPPNQLQLVGILSRGSQRSKDIAASCRVKHYTTSETITAKHIDIACIAIPDKAGEQLALALLNKGINIIIEHPQTSEFINQATQTAVKNHCQFFINSHFANLPASQNFLHALTHAKQQAPCLHYDLGANLRTLFSTLDILGQCLGDLKHINIERLQNNTPSVFSQLQLTHTNQNTNHQTTASIQCQNFASEQDDGSANLLNHRLCATFIHGSLQMNESFGPVHWHPSLSQLEHPQWQNAYNIGNLTVNAEQMMQSRDGANLSQLISMADAINSGITAEFQRAEYLVALAKTWEVCVRLLGV